MRGDRLTALGVLTAAVVMAAMLAGCSGSGVTVTDLRGGPVYAASQDQMTAIQLLKSWFAVIYPLASPPPTHQRVEHTEQVDADTVRVWGTDIWGRAFDILRHDDGEGSGTWFDAYGKPVAAQWDAPVYLDKDTTQTHVVYHFDGMTMDSITITHYRLYQLAATEEDGTATLADGRVLHYRFEDDAKGLHRLKLDLLSEGLTLQIEIPVAWVRNLGWRPLDSSVVTGTVVGRQGSLSLRLTGARLTWRKLEITAASGVTGTYALQGRSLVGSGQLSEGGNLVGTLGWGDDLVGRLELSSVRWVEVTPVAAARDLAVDRWISALAGLAPPG